MLLKCLTIYLVAPIVLLPPWASASPIPLNSGEPLSLSIFLPPNSDPDFISSPSVPGTLIYSPASPTNALFPATARAAPSQAQPLAPNGPYVTNPSALEWYDPQAGNGPNRPISYDAGLPKPYACYAGTASNFPRMSAWIGFDEMWDLLSRDEFGPVDDSTTEEQDLRDAVLQVAQAAKVDARVVLAVVADESTGNVRVGCTNNGVRNCGLMQSHDPLSTSYDSSNPSYSIRQMIIDGVQGTSSGPGLVQLLNDSGDVYTALRLYNSGSADPTNLSDPVGATAAYVSNVANYLTGWDGVAGIGPGGCVFFQAWETSLD